MQAFTSAAENLGGNHLNECTLYVTLEPCVMCAGASFWTQIGRIVFAAADPKQGYGKIVGHVLHPNTKVAGGVMEKECSKLLKDFFQKKGNIQFVTESPYLSMSGFSMMS